MSLWKSKSSGSQQNSLRKENLVSRIRKDIPRIRKQGENPDRDTSSFSRFVCDLCNSPFPNTELRQCILCGRWACPSCWTEEYYVCNSCNGMITLHTLPEKNSR